MYVVVILLFANCLCDSALSTIVEAQQLSHGRSIRQAHNISDPKIQVTEMNIAFDLPDITATIQLLSGTVQLEGFKSVNNDRIDMAGTKTSQLFWVSIGHPHFIKTEDQQNRDIIKFFHSSSRGFSTYVQMMTENQRAALATAAHNKYQIDIADRQLVHLILSKFYCNILLYDDAGSRYLISGHVSDFRHFPLRMDFDISPGKIEGILFSKSITEHENDLHFECHIESSGGKLIKSNTLSISYEQSQQIGLEEKLFGPAGSNATNEIYVSRNQMTELAHEMYSTLNIIEDYQMPETQFSEAFVNDFISQLASSQFNQVPIDTVLASISKYSLDIGADLRPDTIKRDIGSFLSVNKTDGKSRLIFDEKRSNEWANSEKLTNSAEVSLKDWFKVSFSAASDISKRAANNDQTLNDQMRELNTFSQNEAKWEVEGEKIVPKSLNVARIKRSNMRTSLTFKRIRFQQFHAPFERNFKMYTSRSSQLLCQNVSTTKERHEEMLELISHNVLYLMNASRGHCRSTSVVYDCSDIKAYGYTTSGVYRVYVVDEGQRYYANASCDMTTANGPWTVFQRRKDGSVNFYREWNEYANGFGSPSGEFWLGNNFLHLLTSKRRYRLRIDLEDFEGGKRYAEYSSFNISSSADKYRLILGNYSGNAGGASLNTDNGHRFSTKDSDNDVHYSVNCAEKFGGAWWYDGRCSVTNLNGLYLRGRYSSNGSFNGFEGIHWHPWRWQWYSLKTTEMKISSS